MHRLHQRAAGVALLLAVAAGCGQRVPPDADPEVARTSLQTALDAWKGGDRPEALHGRSPPIYLNDPQWHAGSRLLDYQIDPGSEVRRGRGVRFSVVLSLEGKQGKKAQRKVVYQIDTSPSIVIVPADS
jgi:hypothetical protein